MERWCRRGPQSSVPVFRVYLRRRFHSVLVLGSHLISSHLSLQHAKLVQITINSFTSDRHSSLGFICNMIRSPGLSISTAARRVSVVSQPAVAMLPRRRHRTSKAPTPSESQARHIQDDAKQPLPSNPDLSSPKTAAKSVAQQDQELQEKLAASAGDGGSAGVEYEDGKPADMKRSVKNNMFRYI